jgi:hypothetical protein
MRLRLLTWGVVFLAVALIAACRYEEIWVGAAYLDDGTLQLAAQEPMCGCVTVTNTSGQELHLRSNFRGTTLGTATLAAKASLRFGFDWAGHMTDDVYVVDGWFTNGTPVRLQDTTTLRGPEPWEDCGSLSCPWGDLLLNYANVGR